MRKLYHSYLSPYARRVLIVLAEKGLQHDREKHMFAREFAELSSINPCLLLPVFVDEDVHLWGSNLIIEYLLKTYPDIPSGAPETPLATALTRPAQFLLGFTNSPWTGRAPSSRLSSAHCRPRFRGGELQRESSLIDRRIWVPAFAGTNGEE
jgi:glutathione S-transferase